MPASKISARKKQMQSIERMICNIESCLLRKKIGLEKQRMFLTSRTHIYFFLMQNVSYVKYTFIRSDFLICQYLSILDCEPDILPLVVCQESSLSNSSTPSAARESLILSASLNNLFLLFCVRSSTRR